MPKIKEKNMSKITNQSTLTSKYSLPDGSEKENTTLSNVSTTLNMTTEFLKERSSSKDFGLAKDELLQTLVLTNNTEYDIFNVSITDTIGEGATFKQGTVSIDGETKPDLDPTATITLENNISANSSVTIMYTITIDEAVSVQSVDTISSVTYSINEVTDLTEQSNKVTIAIETENITIKKTSNVTAVISGQTIMFQNVIKNEGDIINTNLFFKDPIPEGTTFVTGSVKVNQEEKADFDPAVGFNLDDLNPNGEITVTFEVKVD